MKAKNGTTYKSNYARAAAFFEATCSTAPKKGASEKAAHEFILSIYRQIGENADKLGYKTAPDTSFQPWEQQKGREADVKTIRTPAIKINELMEQLFSFCKSAELSEDGLSVSAADFTPNKSFKAVMVAMGAPVGKGDKIELACGKDCAQGLKKLSEIAVRAGKKPDGTDDTVKAAFLFGRGVFDNETDWLCDGFDYMLGADGKVSALCEALDKLGYKRDILLDGKYISLNYIKEYGKKPEPLKRAWADKNHLGIEISYEDLCIFPATLHLRAPRFAELLNRADELPEQAKTIIREKLKTCDGCHYCIQADKTGTRPLAAVTVDNTPKCPYFPSFSLRWNEVSAELCEQIKAMLNAYEMFD